MKRVISFLLGSLLFFSCSNPPLRGNDVLGADEFVIDSFKIKEGKFAILEMEGKTIEPIDEELLEEFSDRIQEGDILKIVIHHPSRTDLTASVQKIGSTVGFKVTNGAIQLPDLEPVYVKGLTLEEAQNKIEQEYCNQIKDTEVYVSYQERVERKVELTGLVNVSYVPVDGKIRLYEVLSLARIPANANLFRSYVVRNNAIIPVDLYKLVKEGDMKHNIVMQGGDKIHIAESQASVVMVMGEVTRQQTVDLPYGFMTINQALAAAGGINLSGDRSYIQVIRGSIVSPKIYSLNWEHIIRLRSDSLLLIPGDIVYVAAKPISQWSRFVNEILPTIVGIETISRGGKNVGLLVQ